jgi:hypothetical protein
MRFPDSEYLAVGLVEAVVSPVRVATRVPTNRPDEFVRVWRTGGAAANRVLDQPLLTVQCWGPNADNLARLCREAFLHNYSVLPLVRGVVEVTGPYQDPDPGSGVERVTFTMQLQVRAAR